MKKKMSFFGKEFSVFAFAVVVMMAVASAALVPYLSNVVSEQFDVDSPLLLEISATDGGWVSTAESPIELGDIYGGDTATFWMQVTNLATVDVDPVDLSIVLGSDYGDNDDEATCDDFTNVKITPYRKLSGEAFIQQDIMEDTLANLGCTIVDGKITLLLDSKYYAGEIEKYEIELTAELAIAPSTYTVTAQEMVQS